MNARVVPWRRVLAILAIVGVVATAIVIAVRADGEQAVDATVPRATRFFAHRASGNIVLVDGFSGRALARLETSDGGNEIEVAQSASGAAVVDRTSAQTRAIDASALRLGPSRPVGLVAEPGAVVGVGQAGLVTVDPAGEEAIVLPPDGDPVPFDVVSGGTSTGTRIAPDGSVWMLAGGTLTRTTSTGSERIASGLSDARFTLVGNTPFVFDGGRSRARFGTGDWIGLPSGVADSEVVVQTQGPNATCGWLGADDELWCVGLEAIEQESIVDGLGIDGSDNLAIGGDAAALVRRATSEIVRFDWRAGMVLDDVVASVPSGSSLVLAASVDLVWIDQVNGGLVWAVNPWGLNVVRKDDASTPLLDDSGEVIVEGSGGSPSDSPGVAGPGGDDEREPDANGIDDPPVAVDDNVTARAGGSVPITVTANDYDPDGEAIAVDSVALASHGSVQIASATTIAYLPEAGFIGTDRFDYTIVDGNGTTATATVTVELLGLDAANRPPVGAPDSVDTGPDTAVVIDVLLNDIDPERDSIRIESFTEPDVGGTVTETEAPSGLPGLRFAPPSGASGTATFTYRPFDALGAIGDPVEVRVEIAQPTDDNRPPITQPDSIRVRRGIPGRLAVLANDRDPDGDTLSLALVTPLPDGIEATIEGNDLVVVARAGAARLSPMRYTIDDGAGHVVAGNVLISLVDDLEPNQPPVTQPDTAVAVAATSTVVDVLSNDVDPDGDPLIVVRASMGTTANPTGLGAVTVRGSEVVYTAPSSVPDDDVVTDRFTYVVTDGNGHDVAGDVTVRVLPERLAAPPYARDDAATTQVDVPVTIDVLRNDGDPSGERPSLVGVPSCASGGSATVTTDSRVTFRPPTGASGAFRCAYEVVNSQGLRASASITISVVARSVANIAPVVVNEDQVVQINQRFTIDLLANDSDPDGDHSDLRVLSSTTPVLGVATRTGSRLQFEAGSVAGVSTITYQVGDAGGAVSPGRLTIRIVQPEPQAPIAVDDRRTVTAPVTAPIGVDVLANDSDPDGLNGDLVVSSAQLESGAATVSSSSRTVAVLPPTDFVGQVVVSYEITDAQGLTAQADVLLTVLEAPNRAPIARDDSVEIVNGGAARIPIALNDEDPDGDPLSYSLIGPASSALGSARLDGTSMVFDAQPGASGSVNVAYEISDGEATASAVVRVSVLPCLSGQPGAPDLFFRTGYQQPIAIDLTPTAVNGTVAAVGPPLSAASGVYTPPAGENGNVSFQYTVSNACRLEATGTVTIDVNQEPVASPYASRIGRTTAVSIPVEALATDLEPLTIASLQAAPEWVTIAADGRSLRVDPAGRSGRASLVAVVADPGGLSVGVSVSIELVNLAPVAQADTFVIAEATPTVVAPLANDTDPDGDVVSLGAVPAALTFSNGVVGTIEVLADGRLRIDPLGGRGNATFSYTAVDSLGLVSAPATVTATVNRSPVANDLTATVQAGSSADLVMPVSDPDGGTLTLSVIGDPSPLAVQVIGGVLRVTAPVSSGGQTVIFRYRATDAVGAFDDGEVRIDVSAPATTTTTSSTTTTTTVAP